MWSTPLTRIVGRDWGHVMGWKIFINVIFLFLLSWLNLILCVQAQLMAHIQQCQTIRHECYGLPDRVCGHFNMTRRLVRMLQLRVSIPLILLAIFCVDMIVVDPVQLIIAFA